MKDIKPNVLLVAILLVLLLVFAPLPKPAYGGFGGGGIFAYLPQAGVVASSGAFNAATATDTILNVTEAGQLQSLIVQVEDADVTGTPTVDLLLTIDGSLRTIPLYVGGTTLPQWVQNLTATQPSGGSSVFAPQNITVTPAVDLTNVGTTQVFTAASGARLHGLQVTVSTNVTGAGLDYQAFLRFTSGGVNQDFLIYDTGLTFEENGNPSFDGFVINGTGATAGDDLVFTTQLDFPSDLTISVVLQGAELPTTGELDVFIFSSPTIGSGGGISGSQQGNRFRWDISANYLRSLLIQIDRTAVGTSATTLDVTVLRNTRL